MDRDIQINIVSIGQYRPKGHVNFVPLRPIPRHNYGRNIKLLHSREGV